MKKELMEPKYDFTSVEKGKYDEWLKGGYFTSGDTSKIPYTIVIPPPNVTGKLHLGHAWDTTLQDIIIRRKRMQGYDALWLPGMDHAGIATQAKIDAKLKSQGTNRYELGREKFMEVAWAWKKEYAEYIHKQWAALGLSLDYTKERFTLDDGLQKAVQKVFITLYNEGLLYRGERIINWDCEAKTALSNVEVIYKDIEGAFYHILYPFADEEGGLEIATTRPETMFGDVALMVNPKDERYQNVIGKKVRIPGTDKIIEVIADEYVDMEFGTGVVKVTPAHDPNDFEVGNRHNLPRINVLNDDGTMNEEAGIYNGMDRYECRKKVAEDLKQSGYLISVEKMIHSVGHSERTGVIVEPRLSKQWFIKMKPLAEDVVKMQRSDEPIEFIPPRFDKTLIQWFDVDDVQDWCVSRQLWWGHRIPAWYRGDETYVGEEAPEGEGWVQDEDVLDTWFSSALWPFSTLNWPDENSELLKRYYPTDCLVTGYDIITFWVSRMALQGRHFTGKRPFKKCFIHGLIRDEQGRKMSKSLGNGIDPFDLIAEYGCDAMRYFLTTNATPGQDLTFSKEKMASSWNYINKIWNVSRFIQMNLQKFNFDDREIDYNNLNSIDKWILTKTNELIKGVDDRYEDFELGEVARLIYNFTYNDFASWYLELTKVTFNGNNYEEIQNTCAILKYVLTVIIKLLHPFMPFVTEEIYQHFYDGSIMVSDWPKEINNNFELSENIDLLFEVITAVRNIRASKGVSPNKKIKVILENNNHLDLDRFTKSFMPYLEKFINFEDLVILDDATNYKATSVSETLNGVTVIVPLNDLINVEEELVKLNAQKAKLEAEVERSNKMLNNPNFIQKAPAQKVEAEKAKLIDYENQLKAIIETIKSFEK